MRLVSACFVFAFASGCTPDERPDVSDGRRAPAVQGRDDVRANPPVTWEEFRASVQQTGSEPPRFIVDGDILLSNEEELHDFYVAWLAQEYGQLTGSSSARTVRRVPGEDVLQPLSRRFALTYCISNQFGSRKAEVIAGMDRAARSWSDLILVQFVYRPDQDAVCTNVNNNVVFNVRPVVASFLTSAFFMDAQRANRELLIAQAAFTTNAGGRGFEGLLRRELGHILGFQHEHIHINCTG